MSATAERPKSLALKLTEVMADVENIEKDGRNDFHKYDYATAENVLRTLRKPLRERGILLVSSLADIGEREFVTPRGKPSTLTTVKVHMRFIDGETGEVIECDWAGAGDDPADKGLYKAYTGAIRTFLRQTFLLPQGDDPEADRSTDERAAGRNGTQARRGGVSADPPRPTEPIITARQRGLINGRAADAGLSAADFANALISLGGRPPRDDWESEAVALQFVNRQLDRLPARRMDDLLAAIERVRPQGTLADAA